MDRDTRCHIGFASSRHLGMPVLFYVRPLASSLLTVDVKSLYWRVTVRLLMEATDRGVRRRNKEETRRRIFDAAASAFADLGYSGATLDRIAEKFKMKLTKVEAIDPDGNMPNGERGPLTDGDILHTAFNTESGQTTRLTETKDNGYFLLRVDSITPSAEKPLSEVKGQVKDIWLAEKRSAAAAAAAKDIAAAVAAGKSLVEVAGEKQLPVSTSPPVRRSAGGQATLLASLVARIFELKPGETGISEGPNGWYVAQLKSIEVPDPAAAKTAVDQLSDQLTQGIQSDLLTEFDKALRGRYRVEIRQDEIDRAF
jgi:peptidyl-prolyl cis-trans isomerase D